MSATSKDTTGVSHPGHSHAHSLHRDSVMRKNAEGVRTIIVSAVILVATALTEAVVVSFSGSVALFADALHNFFDAFTAIPMVIAFSLARRQPTKRFTYGYGRAEDLSGLFVVLMIGLSAVVAAWQAVERLIHPRVVDNLVWVGAAAVVGFLGRELVASLRIRAGRRIGSVALEADGRHARTDGFTSLVVALGALGVWLGFPIFDPIVGLLIAAMLSVLLIRTGRDVLRRLMDGVDPELIDEIEDCLSGEETGPNPRIKARWTGHYLTADVTLTADPHLTLAEVANLSDHLTLHIKDHIPDLDEVTIHIVAS